MAQAQRYVGGATDRMIASCDSKNLKFIRWAPDYTDIKSTAIVECPTHGEFSVRYTNFVHQNTGCSACSRARRNDNKRVPKETRESQALTRCAELGVTFKGWATEYQNFRTKIIVECPTHGDWHVAIGEFVDRKTSCKSCSRLVHASTREHRMVQKGSTEGYEFVGWVGEYNTHNSDVAMRCLIHGDWITTYRGFIHGDTKCPECANHGYRADIPGYLYGLMSECGNYMKVGISNFFSDRERSLAYRTPFKFSVHAAIFFENGAFPQSLERFIHMEFASAGMRGFDGATEWVKVSSGLLEWFKILQQRNTQQGAAK